MNQDQQPGLWWKWAKDSWTALALVALLVMIVTITILGYWLRWSWTGLVDVQANPDTRLAWDWLGLLIIPIVLGAGALWFNNQTRKSEQELAQRERENDRAIAEDRIREDALQRYLDRMSELVLDKNLKESKRNDAVRATARVGTVARDESREPRFIEPIMDVVAADLGNANLSHADLQFADLGSANLIDTHLACANLIGANLIDAVGWTNERLAQASLCLE
jgi:hypothetical protein